MAACSKLYWLVFLALSAWSAFGLMPVGSLGVPLMGWVVIEGALVGAWLSYFVAYYLQRQFS